MKRLIWIFLLLLVVSMAFWKMHNYYVPSYFKESDNVKIVVFAPISHADEIRNAIGSMGAGKIGNYAFCSFTAKGIGRWIALEGTHPTAGEIGLLQEAFEERIEFICPKNMIQTVLKEIKRIHPYDEFGYDIYPLLESKIE